MNNKKVKIVSKAVDKRCEEIPAKRYNLVSVKLVKESSLLYKERSVKSPKDAYNLLKYFLVEKDREHFVVAALDIKNQPVSVQVCHVGSLNSCIVHPREVMKSAILSNAASIIVGHNHPSGNPHPSNEDHEITKRLKEAGAIIGIELLDHIIVGNDSYLSFNESGYI
ncbi:JAB domain-containing protein [Planococcus halotolerans]|uniref:JAB domain-containing protein n=1 Tax=Planococcus halotolerans TaxID=2233542 RepID=UPI001092B671|nr:DNA repair protein RadC [Planococcus halotolerans]QHJ69217.1 DNA repair protein RadC [Planococcus halotolerans]